MDKSVIGKPIEIIQGTLPNLSILFASHLDQAQAFY